MNREFLVTDLGLQVDGRMIMPGSLLKLNSQAPAGWARFGEARQTPGSNRTFEVATPKPAPEEPDPFPQTVSRTGPIIEGHDWSDESDTEELKAKYKELYGKAPHHKMKAETIQAEIDKALE